MADQSAEWYVQRHKKWVSERGNWDQLMEEIAEYQMPGKRGFQVTFSPGEERTERIYDGTVYECRARFVDAMSFAIANPFTHWFGLEFDQQELNDSHEAVEWLEACYDIYNSELKESNFSDQLVEYIDDWGTFGTSCLFMEEGPMPAGGDIESFNGFVFRSHHMGDVTFGEDDDGRVRSVNIERKMTAMQAYNKFARSVDPGDRKLLERALGTELARTLRDSPDKEVTLLHAICQRDNEDVKVDLLVPAKQQRFASIWCTMDGNRSKRLKVGGYYELPVFVARYRQRSMDKNGIGLGELCQPDVRTLNRAERLDLGAWEKNIDPPIAQQGEQIIGDLDMRAAGITTVRDLSKVRSWNDIVRQTYQPHQVRAEEKREAIRAVWKYHQLDLPPRERVGQMTATEILKRIQRIYQLMGPSVSRLINEGISPLIERGFSMLLRRGAFPPAPDVVVELGGTYSIKYAGPLARAQQLEEVEVIDGYLNDAYQAAQVDPGVMDIVDTDKAWREKAKALGVPHSILRSEDEVAKIRQQRQAAAEEQRQLDAAQQEAAALKDVGAAVGQDQMAQMVSPPELQVVE